MCKVVIQRFFKRIKSYIPNVMKSQLKRFFRYGMIKFLNALWGKEYHARLRAILETHNEVEGIIIYPPTIDWYDCLFQRPQQLAVAFSQKNYLFFYCSPKIYREGFIELRENLFLCSSHVINTLKDIPSPIVFINWAINKPFTLKFPHAKLLLYDHLDSLKVGGENQRIIDNHNKLLQEADIVITTSENLYEEVKQKRNNAILLCPNGVDYEHFHRKRKDAMQPPKALRSVVDSKKPIIGYYGALASWFDFDLLLYCARQKPQYNFVLIGLKYDKTIESYPLKECTNLSILNEVSYEELPYYLFWFHVGTIPFLLNEITHATSPIKLFEYMAGGKPIVTTAMKECFKYKSVLISNTKEEFVENLDKAFRYKDDGGYLQLLDKEARENTWSKRVDLITEAMKDAYLS